jgi:uncharacterized protein YprB with RNaseH-like and TPR domain/predicted nuclease with RNAse H fold/dephospho-CoA kinase
MSPTAPNESTKVRLVLENTFIHLPGIGRKKERNLWKIGIRTWDDFAKRFLAQPSLFSGTADDALIRTLEASRLALKQGDFDFFAKRLARREHYRIALTDPPSTVFLDIETTGLSLYYDSTTLIGANHGGNYYFFSKGGDISVVERILSRAKCIVTFNGGAFDLKFLQKEFPQIRLPLAHVDLRFFGISLGLRGAQKHIEQQLGFERPDDIRTMLGWTAPLLWYRYCRGDMEAGKKLVEYNYYDIEGMKFIFDKLVDRIFEADAASAVWRAPVFFSRSSTDLWRARNNFRVSPFQGHIGTRVRYHDLISAHQEPLRVVGIDLTGSENRATGWCVLEGDHVTTRLLKTDRELIDETVTACPHLVSIDSPLSLPKGRVRVTNDDPGRYEFGILRECERTLKRRGVNVYPSLIDSMQNLTARGIRLATTLRSMGLPVIESYPGAAQDIIGIPRKRASLEYLKDGLGDFGIRGEFLTTKVSHDELDAITSAIVGVFFWGGRFEALGNEDEDYLIIPDLLVPPDPWRDRLVVGISGPIASGKTTGARALEDCGFTYGRYSHVLGNMLEVSGVPPGRETLQELGERMHRERGQRWLSRRLVLDLPTDQDLTIDGLRFPEDHAFMIESFGPAFLHVHVDAPTELREERYVQDGGTAEGFWRAIQHPVEAGISHLTRLAHVVLKNEGPKSRYEDEILGVVGHTARSHLRAARFR